MRFSLNELRTRGNDAWASDPNAYYYTSSEENQHEVRTVDFGFRNSEVSANVLFNPNSTGVLCAAPSTFSIITFLVNMLEAKTNPVNLSFDNAETMV